jgi:hypothetical protein
VGWRGRSDSDSGLEGLEVIASMSCAPRRAVPNFQGVSLRSPRSARVDVAFVVGRKCRDKAPCECRALQTFVTASYVYK